MASRASNIHVEFIGHRLTHRTASVTGSPPRTQPLVTDRIGDAGACGYVPAGAMASECKYSGAKSAPFGHASVCPMIENDRKYSTSRSGSDHDSKEPADFGHLFRASRNTGDRWTDAESASRQPRRPPRSTNSIPRRPTRAIATSTRSRRWAGSFRCYVPGPAAPPKG